jgi:hypothetical protein
VLEIVQTHHQPRGNPWPAVALLLSHGNIKHDFDVYKWAAPEFLEQAAKQLLEERWQKVTAAKLPETSTIRLG